MSKSSPRRSFGRKSSGTITVIEARVHRSSARNARLALILTAVIVGLLSAVVAASYIHPILALLTGALIGVPLGGLAWLLVRIWPVLRLLWWWTPEIGITTLLGICWVQLVNHTETPITLLVVALVVGVPAAVPVSRRFLVAWTWCLVVRHRLRVCFAQFIIANQSGSLPLILWAKPTPVGERVWVYLRPGAQVGSPLVDVIDPDTPATERIPATVPTALDLPDVDMPTVTLPTQGKPAAKKPPASTANGSKPAATSSAVEDDVSDWI
nr:hypothetical protein [Micromonospora purpureochromogenes]